MVSTVRGTLFSHMQKKKKRTLLLFGKVPLSKWSVGLRYGRSENQKPITTRSAPQKSLPMRVIHTRNFFYSIQFFYSELHVWTKSNSGYFLSPHAWLFVKTPVIGNGVSKGFVSVKNYQNIDLRSMIFWMSRSTANFALFFEYTFRKEIVTSYKESRKM